MTLDSFFFFLLLSLLPWLSQGLDNGLALTPPMGWLGWERYGCNTDCKKWPDTCISEDLYLRQAEILVRDGYLDAGYEYVNLDDCWSLPDRDPETGKLRADPIRFPHDGIRGLADRLHSMGLRLGLYTDIGTKTCAGYPGLEGYMPQDVHQFAVEFQIDSLKVDVCHSNYTRYNQTFPALSRSLNRTGRAVLLNCQWPLNSPHHGENPNILPMVATYCNQWRNDYDIYDTWASVRSIIDFWSRPLHQDPLVQAAGPGHWNDPDSLVVGNPGLSYSEQVAQFCLWILFAAPLLLSTNLAMVPENTRRNLLLNPDLLAVHKDPLGRQGWCAEGCRANHRVYVRELSSSINITNAKYPTNYHQQSIPVDVGTSDSWAVVLANFLGVFREAILTFDPEKHLPSSASTTRFSRRQSCFWVRDLLQQEDWPEPVTILEAPVDESSVAMFRITLTNDEDCRQESTTTTRDSNQDDPTSPVAQQERHVR